MVSGQLWKGPRMARGDEGVTTLEITIVFPVFFAALMLVFQAAMYHYTAQVALAAAQVGARQTAIELGQGVAQDQAIADGRTAAVGYLAKNGGSRLRTVDAQPAGGGLNVRDHVLRGPARGVASVSQNCALDDCRIASSLYAWPWQS